MAEQLSFDLAARPALGRDDFFVSPANAGAVALVGAPDWPGGKMVLSGPAGSGKTHLATIWAAAAGARLLSAADLNEDAVTTLAGGPAVIEDVPAIAGDRDRQTLLFHLHNLAIADGHRLLLTGRPAPRHWHLPLADLQSRVDAAPHAALQAPDDALLHAVLAKLFTDRQLNPAPDTLAYLVRHMHRSFAAAQAIVARLDRVALSERRDITRALAARILSDDADPG